GSSSAAFAVGASFPSVNAALVCAKLRIRDRRGLTWSRPLPHHADNRDADRGPHTGRLPSARHEGDETSARFRNRNVGLSHYSNSRKRYSHEPCQARRRVGPAWSCRVTDE